jgi:hypothetical protein
MTDKRCGTCARYIPEDEETETPATCDPPAMPFWFAWLHLEPKDRLTPLDGADCYVWEPME